MKNKTNVFFIFPLFSAILLIPYLFGYHLVLNFPDEIISTRIGSMATQIAKSDETHSGEKIECLVALIKAEVAKTQVRMSFFNEIKQIHKRIVRAALTVFCVQFALAVFFIRYYRLVKIDRV